ncbi:unnamed protein product [Sympodiomycopsis kandeliae]
MGLLCLVIGTAVTTAVHTRHALYLVFGHLWKAKQSMKRSVNDVYTVLHHERSNQASSLPQFFVHDRPADEDLLPCLGYLPGPDSNVLVAVCEHKPSGEQQDTEQLAAPNRHSFGATKWPVSGFKDLEQRKQQHLPGLQVSGAGRNPEQPMQPPIEAGWITLETWVEQKAATRESWPKADRKAFSAWAALEHVIITKGWAIQDERISRDLVCAPLTSKGLLVRGELDLSLPYEEIETANTIEVALLGTWTHRWSCHHEPDALDMQWQLKELVYDTVNEQLPQYATY